MRGEDNIMRYCALVMSLLLLAGCDEELDTTYGVRSGPGATRSVNGTSVFADMFEQAGHRVSSWKSLSPRLKKADCIVWFPDDFRPPSPQVRRWLNGWLNGGSSRTLIFVGRDFDAEPWYWKKVRGSAGADQRHEIDVLTAAAEERFTTARRKLPRTATTEWFSIERDVPPRAVHELSSDSPEWLDGIDPSRLEIELNSRIAPSGDMEPRLESGDDMLVGRLEVGNSQLFVAANGSFLLNAMLVNHEHRKLAGKLVAAIGTAPSEVVFLESGGGPIDVFPNGDDGANTPPPNQPNDPFQQQPAQQPPGGNGPPIRDRDPSMNPPTGLEIAQIWPTNWILLHFAILGVLFCFWKLPLFGRPRPKDPPGASDFGKHIEAVAGLLRRSGDRQYALGRVKHYQQLVKKVE